VANKFERVGPRHPNCCQGTIATGRCNYKAVDGSQFCPLHGGGAAAAGTKRAELRNYVLSTAYAQRAGQLANSGHLKDLTDEVALSRLTLESLLKLCKTDNDFLIYGDKINATIKNVQVLVESLQKMQERNKELLDKQTLFSIADDILQIIVSHVTDPDAQKECGEMIYVAIINRLGGEV